MFHNICIAFYNDKYIFWLSRYTVTVERNSSVSTRILKSVKIFKFLYFSFIFLLVHMKAYWLANIYIHNKILILWEMYIQNMYIPVHKSICSSEFQMQLYQKQVYARSHIANSTARTCDPKPSPPPWTVTVRKGFPSFLLLHPTHFPLSINFVRNKHEKYDIIIISWLPLHGPCWCRRLKQSHCACPCLLPSSPAASSSWTPCNLP